MADPPSSSASISFRARTVSTPARTKVSDDIAVTTSWTTVAGHHEDKSAGESPSRARRSTPSASYFSIPKTFSIGSSLGLFAKRRKTTVRHASHPSAQVDEVLSEVIEIGPERVSRDENNEEAERERLRDAAAQALGLGLGREEHADASVNADADADEEEPQSAEKPTRTSTHPYLVQPIPRVPLLDMSPAPPSLTSLPAPIPSPSIAATSPTDTIPPYPSTLSALVPYVQTRSALLRYHPTSTFLALSLNRRTKQWRSRHVILTAPLPPLPHADLLAVPRVAPQHAHLHLFKNAAPTPDELEMDRLEINEDSVVFVAEHEVAGRRDVVKVGGRDARGGGGGSTSASIRSVARSWHSGATASLEQNIEEMGRTMWLLKMADGGETQHWIAYIKNAVLVQRAERAGMTFQPNGSVPSMRADLDVILSLRSQGLLPNVAGPLRTATPPAPTHNPPPVPSNPRFAEHVGAAPSHSSPPSSMRYPSPSTLSSFKGLFVPGPSSRPETPQQPETHENIDPIAEESGSLGTRATALLNMFRPSSRANTGRASIAPMPMQSAPAPASLHRIGSPITPGPIMQEADRKPETSFSVNWSSNIGNGHANGNGTANGNGNEIANGNRNGNGLASKHASLSLPPPPRNQRRPWTSGSIPQPKSAEPRTPTPPLSPSSRRPASLTSTSSYVSASASVERDRLSDLSRRQSRAVPKMLAPPTGPPPSAPAGSLRAHSPGPPSPHRSWGTQNQNYPYSKRVSSSSVNTVSTGHSFLGGAKPAPPPRPPPPFAPPPAPPTDPDTTPRHSAPGLLPRPLRLSLMPPAAPPTHSLPPRPDEPGYRHRRSSSSDAKVSSHLFSIPGSPTPPPAPPPPSGPLPPTPALDEYDTAPRSYLRSPSLTRRLRIMSTPAPPPDHSEPALPARHSLDRTGEPPLLHPDDHPHMFLHMHDTPTTPAMAHSPSFMHVASPLQASAAVDDVEPTSLSPPPRRNSRASREIRTPNLERDEARCAPADVGSPPAPLKPRDSAVVIEQG